MPNIVNLISPQVYSEEQDQTVYNAEVSGPVAAIILRNTYKGPEKHVVLIANEAQLISTFGNPVDSTTYPDCYRDMLSAIGYLKDSNALLCTRVMPDTAKFAGTHATMGTSATFTPFTSANSYGLGDGGGEITDPDLFADEVAVAGPYVMDIIAAFRGYSGNKIRVAVCDKTDYDKIKIREHGSWDTYSAIYHADTPLETNKNFLVLVQQCGQGLDPTVESNWSYAEIFNVSTVPGEVDDVGREVFVEKKINENSGYIRVALSAEYRSADLVGFSTSSWQVLAGGLNTNHNSEDEWEAVVSDDINSALDLYSNSEDNRLDIFIDSDKPLNSKLKMVGLANARKDCMAILDCGYSDVVNTTGTEAANLQTFALALYNADSNFNTSYAAMYGNWLEVRDKYNNKYRWIPTSGYVAGIFARCEVLGEKWDTPAGLGPKFVFDGVRRLAFNPPLVDRDHMYKFNINPIVSFSGQGKVPWGQKTMLDRDSAFNRINVRRLFITLEQRVSDIAKFYMFKPNTALVRLALVTEITPLFSGARGKGGIDDYKIICNNTNNTEERVMKGELWCDIWVKPTYAVEYIRLNFIATKSGLTFTEVV